MQTLDNITMDDLYQEFINMIQSTPATNNDNIDCAYFLACAVKECMTHKDSKYLGKGYIWEKVSKAMRSIDMPITEQLG